MNFRGNVVDEMGKPLIGANVITMFRPGKQVGTITDFDGVFLIGDAKSDEAWKISYIGFEDIIFRIPRNGGSKSFVMKEKLFELNEVVVTPRNPTNTTPGFNPNADLVSGNNTAQNFQNFIDQLPSKEKKSFWDVMRENPLLAVGAGIIGTLGIGFLLAQLAKASDKAEQKRLANA